MVTRGVAALALVLDLLLGTAAQAQNKAVLDGVWNHRAAVPGRRFVRLTGIQCS